MQPKKIEEQDQSDFNSGIATLMRIDEIKKHILMCTEAENNMGKFRYLFDYYMELSPLFKGDDGEDQYKKFKYMKGQYNKIKNSRINGKPIRADAITYLDDWELELRRLEQEYGLNMPKKKDARYSLGRK